MLTCWSYPSSKGESNVEKRCTDEETEHVWCCSLIINIMIMIWYKRLNGGSPSLWGSGRCKSWRSRGIWEDQTTLTGCQCLVRRDFHWDYNILTEFIWIGASLMNKRLEQRWQWQQKDNPALTVKDECSHRAWGCRLPTYRRKWRLRWRWWRWIAGRPWSW